MIPILSEEGGRFRGRWLRLLYSQSFLGQPARPLVRFVRAGGCEEHLLAAAALGRGAWTWKAPADLRRIEVLAPAGRAAALRVDALRPLAFGAVLLRLMRHPRRLLHLLPWVASERGRNVDVHEAFDLAPPDDFARYAREHRRPFEPDGLDAGLGAAAASGPRLGFVLPVREAGDLPLLRRTLAAFARQLDAGWCLLILAPAALAGEIEPLPGTEIRIGNATEEAALAAACGLDAGFVARLLPGDEPDETAVACLRAHLASRPGLSVLYADSALRIPAGISAQLKPDWSPAFQEGLDYVGRPCLVRRTHLGGAVRWRDLPDLAAQRDGAAAVGHLKRVLFTLAPAEPALPAQAAPREENVPATLIVPTRDRVELLLTLCESVFEKTPAGSYEMIVVDNGSEDEAALSYLRALEERPDLRVLRQPGPFNFSALVNAGAEAARGEVLVLLNNDCEIIAGDWLCRLVSWATRPDIGAVGAKLLYADGRIQHAGVALGLGGEAGHRDRRMPRGHPGMLGRLTVPHEVAAVTAACLAVSRATWREAGGFDEVLPVAFNDIDFCLRLLRRGYRNILDPQAVLVHAESASRGREEGARRARFLKEAALFRERWGEMLRDDPYWHPLLSTFRFPDRLG